MKKFLPLLSIFWFFTGTAQQPDNLQQAINYIEDYYSNFTTGYDYNSSYVALSENYKVTIKDSIFSLSYDVTEDKPYSKNTVTVNFKDVLRLEPYGADVVEVAGNDPLLLPVCGKLAFIMKFLKSIFITK